MSVLFANWIIGSNKTASGNISLSGEGSTTQIPLNLSTDSNYISFAGTGSTTQIPPSYYGRDLGLEVIDIIEEWGLGFHLGNVLKYTVRAGKKGSASLDLKKALWYAKRFSDTLEPPSRCI